MFQALGALALTAAVLTVQPASAMECKKQVTKALSEAGIPSATLIQTDKLGNSQGKDYFMWFTIPECEGKGYINVTVNNHCYVHEVFTRWGCRIPGVRHYRF